MNGIIFILGFKSPGNALEKKTVKHPCKTLDFLISEDVRTLLKELERNEGWTLWVLLELLSYNSNYTIGFYQSPQTIYRLLCISYKYMYFLIKTDCNWAIPSPVENKSRSASPWCYDTTTMVQGGVQPFYSLGYPTIPQSWTHSFLKSRYSIWAGCIWGVLKHSCKVTVLQVVSLVQLRYTHRTHSQGKAIHCCISYDLQNTK